MLLIFIVVVNVVDVVMWLNELTVEIYDPHDSSLVLVLVLLKYAWK